MQIKYLCRRHARISSALIRLQQLTDLHNLVLNIILLEEMHAVDHVRLTTIITLHTRTLSTIPHSTRNRAFRAS